MSDNSTDMPGKVLAPYIVPPDTSLPEEIMAKVSGWKDLVKQRCWITGIPVRDEDVHAVVEGGFIYVLANPIVGHETVMEGTPLEREVPRRNFELEYQPQVMVPFYEAPETSQSLYDQVPLEMRPERIAAPNPEPFKLRPIIAPYLAVRLTLDGDLDADGADSFDFPVRRGQDQ